jgi:Recombination endonuclease VII
VLSKRKYNREYYEANRERLRAQQREYWSRTKEQRLAQCKSKYKANRVSIRAQQSAYRKKHILEEQDRKLKALGWTLGRKSKFLKDQKGLCAICRVFMEKPCADHRHSNPPVPRKLLCITCNTGLGQFKDSPELLRSAAQYLEDSDAQSNS